MESSKRIHVHRVFLMVYVIFTLFFYVQTPSSRSYDVYRDSNVAEVVKCRSVLDALVMRVRQLLAEFPDWPTLVQVSTLTCLVVQ